MKNIKMGIATALLLLLHEPNAYADQVNGFIEVIAVTGDPAPGGLGVFFNLTEPVLNNQGQIAFRGAVTGIGNGIFRADPNEMVAVAVEGQAVPDGGGEFGDFSFGRALSLNGKGMVAFVVPFINNATSGSRSGVYFGDGILTTKVIRKGDTSPDGNGVIDSFETNRIAFNDLGQIAIVADLTNTSGGASDNEGLYFFDGNELTQRARRGQAVPGLDGNFGAFFPAAINDVGQVSFLAFLNNNVLPGRFVVFRNQNQSFTKMARLHESIQGGTNSFIAFDTDSFPINDLGQVGIVAQSDDGYGVFRSDNGEITQLVLEGDSSPDGNGIFRGANFFDSITMNDGGQAVFGAGLALTQGDGNDDFGVFRSDGIGIQTIVRKGELAPNGQDVFRLFSSLPSVNACGQVAFGTRFSAGAANLEAIYMYDDFFGLVEVIRVGMPLAGGTVQSVDFIGGNRNGEVSSAFNDQGQIAFRFGLAEGGHGVAIWNRPVLLADVNRDGSTNILDIAPFVSLVLSGNFQLEADINCDSAVDLLDIEGFVEILAN